LLFQVLIGYFATTVIYMIYLSNIYPSIIKLTMILPGILLYRFLFYSAGRFMGLLLLINLCLAPEIQAEDRITEDGLQRNESGDVGKITADVLKKTQENNPVIGLVPGAFPRDQPGTKNGPTGSFFHDCGAISTIYASLFLVFLIAIALFIKKTANRKNIELLAEIRERKKLEKCLIDSRQAYIKLVDNLPQRIFLKDRDSVYIQCNRAYADDLGIPVNKIAGKTDYDFFPAPKSGRYLRHDRKVIETDTVMEYEDEYFANHPFAIVKIAKVPIHGDDGGVTGILGIIWDITREKMAEKALVESEKQFRNLIDQASDAVTIADMKGKIVDANIKACESLGYTYEELLALHMNTLDPVTWSSHTPPLIWKDLSESRAVITETHYHRKNGSTFPVEVSMSLHKESGSNLILNIARDITPRHLALKQQANMGRIIEDSLSETYIIASGNLHFLVANRGARENIGYNAEELKLKTITDICPGLTRDVFHNLVAPIDKQDKERVRLETTFHRRDKTTYPVDIFIQFTEYLFYPVYVLQAVDLSERKKYEQELQNAVDIINKSSSVAFIWQKADGLPVIFVTRNVELIFGYSEADLLSQKKSYAQLIQPEHYDSYMAEIKSGATNPHQEIIDHCAYRIVTRDNKIKWVSDYTYIKRDQGGNIIGYQGIVDDITALKENEFALRRSRDEWERTFHAIPDIVTMLDRDCRVVKINQAGCEQFGLSSSEIFGIPCHKLFGDTEAPCAECPITDTITTLISQTREIFHQKLNKTFLVTTSPMLDDNREVIFIVHVAKDITAHKKMEQQLFLSEKMTTIAGLAAGVAHEINTPLSAILQSIEVVRNSLDDTYPDNRRAAGEYGLDLTKVNQYFKEKEVDFYLDGIRHSALNASRIIANLLDFSRPQKGDLQEVDIHQLIENSLDLARADYNLKKKYDILNFKVKKEYAVDMPMVMCVPMEIEQVILNLIKNAVHAMVDGPGAEKPCLTLRTAREGEAIRIEVRDNGPGIEESVQKHIFDPFFTTKETGLGTGLGLSVSYAIIHDKHHGAIRVESKSGQGAAFVVLLPLRQRV
jgi:PAS domain S-box-containing protein